MKNQVLHSKGNSLTVLNFLFVLVVLTGLIISPGFYQKAVGQTYGHPCFTETFGVVPSSYVGDPNYYREEISGRGEMGMDFWFWPLTCTGSTGYKSVPDAVERTVLQDTSTFPPRQRGYSIWRFFNIPESVIPGTPFNGSYRNNPNNVWCLYEYKRYIWSEWEWTYSGPNTACPSEDSRHRNIFQVRWYNRGGTWMLGFFYRFTYKVSIPCSQFSPTMDDGGYCLSPNPNYVHRPDNGWLSGQDHTPGDVNGLMLVVNAAWERGQFYKRRINGLCFSSQFEFKAYYANILNPTFCTTSLPINIRFEVWSSDPGDNEENASVPIGGHAANGAVLLAANNTGNIAATSTLIWRSNSIVYQMPLNQDYVYIVLRNNAAGGCGNDLAIDDITFTPYLPFTLDYSIDYNDYCLTRQIKLNANLVSGSIPTGSVFQWRVADASLNNWTDIGAPFYDINNSTLTLDVSTIANKKFRLKAATNIANFNNVNCFVTSNEFIGSTIHLPTAYITGPDDVCGTPDHQPRSATLTINYEGTAFPWTYYYKIDGGPEQSVTVPSPFITNDVIINNITDTTVFELLRVMTSDCSGPLEINETHTILYSVGTPGPASPITGPNPACIGSEADFSVPPVTGATYYNWILSNGWSVVAGQGTPNVRLLIGSTPIYVTIETQNACGTNSWTSEIFNTTYDAPPAPADIIAPLADCLNPVVPGSTDILFEASEVLGVDAYYWEWDAPLTLGTQQPGTGQYLQRIVLSVPNNITSFNVRVRVQNLCGYSPVREVTFTPEP